MTDDVDQRANRDECDLSWYAAHLDESASSQSRYEMALELRERLGYGWYDDLPEDTPAEARATCWAFDYRFEISEEGGRRVTLVSRHNFGDSVYPPAPRDVPPDVKELWRALVGLLRAPAAKARLAYLLMECGGSQRRADGTAYVASATDWAREGDSVDDLRIATRLARAVGDEARAKLSLDRIIDLAVRLLDDEPQQAGTILRALTHALNEPLSTEGLDDVLESAATKLRDVGSRDHALKLMPPWPPTAGAACSTTLCAAPGTANSAATQLFPIKWNFQRRDGKDTRACVVMWVLILRGGRRWLYLLLCRILIKMADGIFSSAWRILGLIV